MAKSSNFFNSAALEFLRPKDLVVNARSKMGCIVTGGTIFHKYDLNPSCLVLLPILNGY